MEHSAGAAAVVASTATATTMTTNGSLGENTNKQLGNGTSTSSPSTVCYLANGGGSGHIDRLNLVLPLSSSTTTIPITTTELIFSPTSQLPQLNSTSLSHSELPNSTDNHLVEEEGDVDRTPVNTATETKGRLFSFSSLASSSTSSSSNSCRTVDSGTESLCSGDGGGAPGITLHDGDHHSHSRHPHSTATDLAADRILKFFASEDSKSSRFAAGSHRQRRRPTSANIRQTSTEDDDDVDEEEEDEEGDGNNPDDQEDVYSDESTLSESSVSPSAEFAPSPAAQLITPESVVAAIDAKIKQREVAAAAAAAAAANQAQQQNRSTMVTADKETAVLLLLLPLPVLIGTLTVQAPTEGEAEAEAEAVVPISGSKNYLKVPEEGADYENDDELDIEEYGDGDGDDDGCGPPVRLIRSTSLKTGKTPPGTPRGKKIVRFADALGLDLESVRHIVDDGKPYMPPLAAFKGLALDDEDRRWFFGGGGSAGALTGIGIGGGGSGSACSATAAEFSSAPTLNSNNSGLFATIPATNSAVANSSSSLATTTPHLRMLFAQPSSDPGPFLERVRSHRLCLENCLVSGPSGPSDLFTVTCITRVLNVGFEKSLLLRYTTNEWLTWTDVPASYVAGSCDGFSDKFSVTFHVAVNSNGHQSMMPGQRLLFALRYLANGGAQEFWDNNMGLNYSLIYQRS
ncbi:hypothetical protein TYRP_022817 [Tyrophagus putrescentiae]|nr:hypothetical protein TYRP_022817 [Tyrophagus putrescentiae]